MNSIGRNLRLSLFGESHGPAIGGVIDGLPAGMPVDEAAVEARMAQRRPGSSKLVTARQEMDNVQFLSGVFAGRCTGAPLAFTIANQDTRSKDYSDIRNIPRPGHSDHVAEVWSKGHNDHRGGGHYSGRLTACLVAAGAIVEPLLAACGVGVGAHLHAVRDAVGPANGIDVAGMHAACDRSEINTAHGDLDAKFIEIIEAARSAKDSVGGIIEWRAEGVPIALGDPMMDSVESVLAHIFYAVPAVKGTSFGQGFGSTSMMGSEHNDDYHLAGGKIGTTSNNSGGILGGRTTGAPLWGHVAIKPTSSIFQPQNSVDKSTMQETELELKGRHDPCIAIRAVPVIRAAAGIAIADLLLLGMQQGHVQVPEWAEGQ